MAGETISCTLDDIFQLSTQALITSGANRENAEAVAEVVTSAERDGCLSHGIFRIPGYCTALKAGGVNGNAAPKVIDQAPGVVRVVADNGLAPLAVKVGRPALIEKTKSQGIASLAIGDSAHFAALWPDTQPLAEAGLVAMSFVNSRSFMAPAGGKSATFGTNPMSFAVPRPGKPPMVWDQASSASARGEIMIAARDGHSVPEGWGLGPNGEATTDPNAILKGVQLPFGGYKGGAIAMMVEILAACMTGGDTSLEAEANYTGHGGPSAAGHLILAMDPARFGQDRFLTRIEGLFEAMLADEGVRLPGDRRLSNRATTPATGVQVPKALHDTVSAIAAGN
ncbi:MAG: Ldh family oxidoreductase [Alphaproteobacteria bacterium]